MNGKRATLADVARLAGLSPTAASMILNDRPNTRLSQDARDRVHAAAQALGYRPNVAARALRTDRSHTVAFISDMVSTTRFASGLIEGALDAAERAGYVVFVMETGGDRHREDAAVAAVLDRQVDGIIFASMRAREVATPRVPDGTPVVMLNAYSPQHQVSVLPDEEAGGRAAVDMLLDLGHRDGIALIGQNDDVERSALRSITVARRIAGIRAATDDRGLSFAEECSIELWEPSYGFGATESLLRRRHDITALVCMNDRLAFGAYQALAAVGASIPRDVSLVSFDNDELAAYLRLGLSTIALPYREMGHAAVDALLAPPGTHVGERLLPMPPVIRESLAVPSR